MKRSERISERMQLHEEAGRILELEGKGLQEGADGVAAALGSAADLIAHAAESLLLSLAGGGVGMLGKWRPPTEDAGLAMLRGCSLGLPNGVWLDSC